jgi:hypothetical protein
VAAASRWLGKGWCWLTGNKQGLSKLEEMSTQFPGMIKECAHGSAQRDPMASAMPYYTISEAITSAMVARGVYLLSRVTAPFFDAGIKLDAAPQNVIHHAEHQERVQPADALSAAKAG